MAAEDPKQKQECASSCLNRLLHEGKQLRDEAEQINAKILAEREKSKDAMISRLSEQTRLELSHIFAKAAQIYSHAVHLIENDPDFETKPDHDRLAFLAYQGYGISLHWKLQYERDRDVDRAQSQSESDDDGNSDNDSIAEEEDKDMMTSKEMLFQAVQIAKKHAVNLPWEESSAYGSVAAELEGEGHYEEAFDLFYKVYSIYESERVEYNYILGSGLRMVACFEMAEDSKGDTSWLAKKAGTVMSCLERLISVCDLAENGDKETVERFCGRFPRYLTHFVAEDKKFAAETLERLKSSYPNADVEARG